MIMKYQKIINLLDKTPNQLSKFRPKNGLKKMINQNDCIIPIVKLDLKLHLKSSLYDYSDAYILVKGRITITSEGADAAAIQADERNKGVIFKNCVVFTNCKSEINNAEIDNAKDIDIVNMVVPMLILIEYSDSYSKTSESLWQC